MVEAASLPLGDRVRVRQVTGRSILRLKSWLPATETRVRVAGVELPTTVTATAAGELRALCTGASDWLLVSPGPLSEPARAQITAEGANQHLAVAELSAGLAVFEVSGPAARGVLAKGCGLDLDPQVFAYPKCARTRLAQLAVVIDALKNDEGFDLYVARSHGPWLSEWLADAVL